MNKEITAYCIKHPYMGLMFSSIEKITSKKSLLGIKNDCIKQFTPLEDNLLNGNWDALKDYGYRCVKIKITEL